MGSRVLERGTLVCWVEEKGFWRRLRGERRRLGRLYREGEKEYSSFFFIFSLPFFLLWNSIFSSSFLEASKATDVSERDGSNLVMHVKC